ISGLWLRRSCREASFHQTGEEMLDCLALLITALHAVEAATELVRAGPPLQSPARIPAGKAQTLLGAVQPVQGVQMLQQQPLLPGRAGLGRYLAMAQIVFDLAEDPGPALGRPTYHDRVGPGVLQNLS